MAIKLSEARRAIRTEIDMHSDNGYGYNRHMAVNVKYHGRWPAQPANMDDDTYARICEAAFEATCATF